MKVLIGCEFSGLVRQAFKAKGHDAISCDLIDTEIPGKHHKGDVIDFVYSYPDNFFDIGIFFPPCRYLCVSGARWFNDRKIEQIDALDFVRKLMMLPIDKICIENPIGVISTKIRKPEQIIQPWMFGHGETKSTCLWLKNLPLLKPTNIVEGRNHRIHYMTPNINRSKDRSRTYPGIAQAMAEQWS